MGHFCLPGSGSQINADPDPDPQPSAEQQAADKIPATWGLIIITTKIMHGKQGQYSRVPMLPHLCEILNSGTHCVMDYSYT